MLSMPSRAMTPVTCLSILAAITFSAGRVCAQAGCTAAPVASVTPSDGGAYTGAGISLATNATGDRVALGSLAHGHSGVQSGAAWVISNPGTLAQTEAELIPAGAFANMFFGYSLAMNASGDVVVAGAPASGTAAGSPGHGVYAFRFNGSAWVEELHGPGISSDQLGFSVATNAAGDLVAAGAPRRSSANYWIADLGGVDLYRHQASGWVLEATVLPQDATGGDMVGNYIALSADGNVLAMRSFAREWNVISNGAVYLFEHTGGAWQCR